MDDPYNLDRFLTAQNDGGTYDHALAELRGGSKRGHWMWFVFPQIAGLGQSATSRLYAISSLDEARAYLAQPLLGKRLRLCVEALQDLVGSSATEVFGEIDAIKLRSSLTLFWQAGGGAIFEAALMRWSGSPDPRTLELLRQDETMPHDH